MMFGHFLSKACSMVKILDFLGLNHADNNSMIWNTHTPELAVVRIFLVFWFPPPPPCKKKTIIITSVATNLSTP